MTKLAPQTRPCLPPLRSAPRLVAAAALAALVALHAPVPAGAQQADPPRPSTNAGTNPDNETDATATTPAPNRSAITAAPTGRVAKNLAIVPIRTQFFDDDPLGGGMIDNVTARSVKRRIELAEDAGADAIAFEIDTPGGSLPAVLEITEAIRSTNLYTIAWINTQAISGGAVIALACNEIVVHPAATLGDAGIVTMGRSLGPTERAKAISPLLADLVDSARRNGYDEVLVQSLVSLGVETWEVRNTETGQSYFLTRSEYRALFGEEPPDQGSPYIAAGGEIDRDWQQGAQFKDEPTPEGVKQVEPDRSDFVEGNPEFTDGIRRDTLRTLEGMGTPAATRPDFSREDADDYRFVRYVTSGDTFLTMQAQAMRDLGFAAATINDREELRNYTSTDEDRVRVYTRSFAESLAKFMTGSMYGMVITVLLIIVFLVSLFIELSAPGMGVFGTVALIALAAIVTPQIMMNAAAWWLPAAILAGVGLILIEAFVTPGFGLPGVSGLALLLLGLVGSFSNVGQAFPGMGDSGSIDQAALALALVLLALFAAGVAMYLVSRYTKSIPVANRMILSSPPKSESMLAAMDADPTPDDAPVRVGQTGVATSTLRPSGSAEFDGELVSVVAQRGMIEKGTQLRVTEASSFRVAVVPESEPDAPATPDSTPPTDPENTPTPADPTTAHDQPKTHP